MKLFLSTIRSRRAPAGDEPVAPARRSEPGDDTLGRGMDLALTVLVFLVLGYLVDTWVGVFPVFTIGFVVFAAIGAFVRMKYVYDAAMTRLEADRRAALAGKRGAA